MPETSRKHVTIHIGDGKSFEYLVRHNLGTPDPRYRVYRGSTEIISPKVAVCGDNVIIVYFDSPIPRSSHTVIIEKEDEFD